MAASFNSVTPDLLAELRNVLGDKFVKTDEDYLERYQTEKRKTLCKNHVLSFQD